MIFQGNQRCSVVATSVFLLLVCVAIGICYYTQCITYQTIYLYYTLYFIVTVCIYCILCITVLYVPLLSAYSQFWEVWMPQGFLSFKSSCQNNHHKLLQFRRVCLYSVQNQFTAMFPTMLQNLALFSFGSEKKLKKLGWVVHVTDSLHVDIMQTLCYQCARQKVI